MSALEAVSFITDYKSNYKMRAARRRQRRPDPLASPEAVRAVFASLRSVMPDVIPTNEKRVIALLHAARHVQRYSATDTKRGRRSNYDRSVLIKVAARTADILDRETSSRLGFASFVDHYLRLLEFPSDVLDALKAGDINLFEAAQLARLSSSRLGVGSAQAKRTRSELLKAHLSARLSSTRLRLRVNELLVAPSDEASNGHGHVESVAPDIDELELLDEYDPTHLFWDQIKHLVLALRAIQPGDVEDAEIEELLEASEPILNVLAKIQRRKARKVMKLKL